MEKIANINSQENNILQEIRSLVFDIKTIIENKDIETLEEGIDTIWKIRNKVYENLNQLQHAGLILKAAKKLQKEKNISEWFWHPYQTSGPSEPDLRGISGSEILISAEVTTSKKAVGTIKKRMENTLNKLSKMEGELFYVVRTNHMAEKAISYISANNLKISVINLY